MLEEGIGIPSGRGSGFQLSNNQTKIELAIGNFKLTNLVV